MSRYDPAYLDSQEKALLREVRKVDVRKLARPTKAEQAALRAAARAFALQESKMNIRISTGELALIKAKAAQEGLRYQSLVKSVLHKYVTGQLVDRDRSRR